MEPDEIQNLYGGRYAAHYNSIWQESERWHAEAAHHVRSLRTLVGPSTRWLDVGCGTGWNLSQFPGTERAGIDLSPDMLAEARASNPDALFLREADIRDDVAEWHDQWNLVTCTGQPWSYVRTMGEIEAIFDNLARWTAPDGVCFLPMGDLTDLTGQPLAHPAPGEDPPYDSPVITGAIWSLHESDRDHIHMIWPSIGFCIDVFARHFKRIEIVRWPHDPPWIPVARRVLVCRDKRQPGDAGPVEIIEHPVPGAADAPEGQDIADVTVTEAVAPTAEPAEVTDSPPAIAAPAETQPGPGERLPGRSLRDQPLSYLAGRVKPWSPSFWRSLRRRVRR